MSIVKCCNCLMDCYKKPSQIAKSLSGEVFCGNTCRSNFRSKWVLCLVCAAPIRAGLKRTTCSRSCSNRNRFIINQKQIGVAKKDKVESYYEIRKRLINYKGLESCERCQYDKIPSVVQVHHIIERSKGGSNKLENLEFLCPTCHMEEHWTRKQQKLLGE